MTEEERELISKLIDTAFHMGTRFEGTGVSKTRARKFAAAYERVFNCTKDDADRITSRLLMWNGWQKERKSTYTKHWLQERYKRILAKERPLVCLHIVDADVPVEELPWEHIVYSDTLYHHIPIDWEADANVETMMRRLDGDFGSDPIDEEENRND